VLVKVADLKEGSGIGEKALLSGKPRAATVIVNKDSYFISIDKGNYEKFILEANKKEDEWKVIEISKFSVFSKMIKKSK